MIRKTQSPKLKKQQIEDAVRAYLERQVNPTQTPIPILNYQTLSTPIATTTPRPTISEWPQKGTEEEEEAKETATGKANAKTRQVKEKKASLSKRDRT